ncbi:MAG: nodulation protein NfeD, partial [Proteobacteria bacterium]|nr:nodulation protein NfeD [Pseudomonadota bacterium]
MILLDEGSLSGIITSVIRTLLLSFLLAAFPAAARTVSLIEIDGPIGPVAAEYVVDALTRARKASEPLAVLRLDTPGGLDRSMRRIVRAVVTSDVPVVAWVGPSGARAASAGLFVVAAAHVAAMAPGTNLGAAHPVSIGGKGMDETLAKKAEEDAAAYIRALAQQRGRDPAWFEGAVVESESLSAEEALEKGVIDLISGNLTGVLEAVDGREVSLVDRKTVLRTEGLVAVPVPMSLRQRALRVLADPNIAYLLLLLGFYGLFFELSNPGSIFPGVLGGLCLILAFVGLQTLPFNYGGVLLILLGLLLLLLEVKITSFGLLTVGGVVSLTLGSLMLFRTAEAFQRLSVGVILPAVGATVAFFVFAVGKGLAAQRTRRVSGREGLVGEKGRALEPL